MTPGTIGGAFDTTLANRAITIIGQTAQSLGSLCSRKAATADSMLADWSGAYANEFAQEFSQLMHQAAGIQSGLTALANAIVNAAEQSYADAQAQFRSLLDDLQQQLRAAQARAQQDTSTASNSGLARLDQDEVRSLQKLIADLTSTPAVMPTIDRPSPPATVQAEGPWTRFSTPASPTSASPGQLLSYAASNASDEDLVLSRMIGPLADVLQALRSAHMPHMPTIPALDQELSALHAAFSVQSQRVGNVGQALLTADRPGLCVLLSFFPNPGLVLDSLGIRCSAPTDSLTTSVTQADVATVESDMATNAGPAELQALVTELSQSGDLIQVANADSKFATMITENPGSAGMNPQSYTDFLNGLDQQIVVDVIRDPKTDYNAIANAYATGKVSTQFSRYVADYINSTSPAIPGPAPVPGPGYQWPTFPTSMVAAIASSQAGAQSFLKVLNPGELMGWRDEWENSNSAAASNLDALEISANLDTLANTSYDSLDPILQSAISDLQRVGTPTSISTAIAIWMADPHNMPTDPTLSNVGGGNTSTQENWEAFQKKVMSMMGDIAGGVGGEAKLSADQAGVLDSIVNGVIFAAATGAILAFPPVAAAIEAAGTAGAAGSFVFGVVTGGATAPIQILSPPDGTANADSAKQAIAQVAVQAELGALLARGQVFGPDGKTPVPWHNPPTDQDANTLNQLDSYLTSSDPHGSYWIYGVDPDGKPTLWPLTSSNIAAVDLNVGEAPNQGS